jgi:tight adherence protein C
MDTTLLLTLGTVFVAVALTAGLLAMYVMTRDSATSRRRLNELVEQKAVATGVFVQTAPLTETEKTGWDKLAEALPTSRGSVKRLRRDLTFAGFTSGRAAALFSLSELILPFVFALPPFLLLTGFNRWLAVAMGLVVGYMAPNFFLGRRITARRKQIQNGLADLLDLLVLCLEAGSGLDQAIVKASDELQVAYPAMADQLQMLIAEMRAGKPRIEAFKALAQRTQVEDVRALVSMLVQTDRFGTSVAQSLRAQADVCRTKRRQRAEERAQKVSVKLVFPLVFCLFPALYVVLLGPAFIQFGRIIGSR